MVIATNNLLNLITWFFIGLTVMLFIGYLVAYILKFKRANNDLKAFDIKEFDSARGGFASLFDRYTSVLKNNRTSEYANDFINIDSVANAYKIRTDVLNTIPNILTSLGILGTFVGLSVAIISFNAVSSDSIRDSINVLLQGMGTAFFTSVAGMFFSSIFLMIERHWINKLSWRIDEICDKIDQMHHASADQIILDSFRLTIEEGYIVEPNELLASVRESVKDMQNTLSRFGTDLCDSIGNAMDNSFQDKLVPILNDLSSKLENPAQALTDSLMLEFRNICNDFRENLTKGVNDQMNELIERFIDASNAINNIPETLDTVNKELTECTGKAVESYKAMSESLENHVKQFDELSDTFTFSIERINEAFISLSELHTQLQLIPEAVAEAKEGINTASTNLKDIIENISESLENASKINSDTGNKVDSYLSQISSIQTGLKGIFEEITIGLNKYSNTAKDGLQNMLNPFTTSVTDAAQNITNSIAPLHDTVGDLNDFSMTIHEAITAFSKTTQSLDSSIRELSRLKDLLKQQQN